MIFFFLNCLDVVGLIVKNAIQVLPGMAGPWPPTAQDLTMESMQELSPCQLYNLLAWCVGATNEPDVVAFTKVKDEVQIKLLSIY